MNVNNYGVRILFSTGFNMSAATALSLILTSPTGVVKTFTNPAVSVVSVDEETTAGLFPANQHVQYVTQNGDINEVGVWSARLDYTGPGPEFLTSDPAQFTVDP